MLIKNYHGRTGAGKSTVLKENIIQSRGRHLLVVPRRSSIDECYNDLMRLNAEHGAAISIFSHKREEGRRYKTKIVQEITDRAAEFANEDDHCCLIVTQAAFQLLDLSHFAGWHLKLDELLTNGNLSGSLFAPVMWRGLTNMFSIEPLTEDDLARGIDGSLRRACLKPGIEPKDAMNDPFFGKAEQNLFHRLSSSVPVYIDAQEPERVGQRRCLWCSPWTLDLAKDFASIEIAACDIEQSLMHMLAPRTYEMKKIETSVSKAGIRIVYFDASPATCSANYWETDQGQANLKLIGEYIASSGGVDFWTCNESAEDVLKPLMPKASPRRTDELNDVDGTWITQQQDGTNLFRTCTSCAILISSKAQEHESIFAKLSTAADRTAISKSREDGLIFQFCSRGAIRCEDFAGDYSVYVFDRQQAEALRDKLIGYGFPETVIEHVALDGFTDRVRPPKGRKPTYVTPEERLAAQRADGAARVKKHRDNQRKAAERSARPSEGATPLC